MKWSRGLGRVAGTSIHVHATFLILAAGLGWTAWVETHRVGAVGEALAALAGPAVSVGFVRVRTTRRFVRLRTTRRDRSAAHDASGSSGCAATQTLRRLRRDRPELPPAMGIIAHFCRSGHRDLDRSDAWCWQAVFAPEERRG